MYIVRTYSVHINCVYYGLRRMKCNEQQHINLDDHQLHKYYSQIHSSFVANDAANGSHYNSDSWIYFSLSLSLALTLSLFHPTSRLLLLHTIKLFGEAREQNESPEFILHAYYTCIYSNSSSAYIIIL